MESLLVNLGRAVPQQMGGRDYLVAPLTLIVPGVLNGSQGPIYYPEDEVERWPGLWNHVPLVVYHPVEDGQHVTARSPDVLDKSGVGLVLRDQYVDNRRSAEAWFEVEATKRVDKTLAPAIRILPRLLSGAPIEISTGLDLDKEPAPSGAVHNDTPYEHIARNFRPDHLAILPDAKGACSNKDGCGVNVNEESTPTEGDVSMTRKDMIQHLTANCDCWKGKGDKAILDKMDDDKLTKLVNQSRVVLVVNQIKNKKANAGGDEAVAGVPWTELATLLGVDLNPADDPIAFAAALKSKVDEISSKLGGAPAEPVMDDGVTMGATPAADDEDEDKVAMSATEGGTQEKVGNKKKGSVAAKPQTATEWLKGAPPEVRSAVTNAMSLEKQAKAKLVQRLVGNVSDAAKRQATGAKLMTKSLDELQELVSLIPEAPVQNGQRQEALTFAYAGGAGAGGGIVGNEEEQDDSDNVLPVFAVNFEEMASPKLRRQQTA